MLQTDKTVTLILPFSEIRTTWLLNSGCKAAITPKLIARSAYTPFMSFKMVTVLD